MNYQPRVVLDLSCNRPGGLSGSRTTVILVCGLFLSSPFTFRAVSLAFQLPQSLNPLYQCDEPIKTANVDTQFSNHKRAKEGNK